ncbi:hypothetical protein ACS0S2_24020, partial [Escherichia coli]
SEVSISPLFRWPNSVNHFNKHGQVEFTEKVPADAMVCTLERFKFYLEQHGWIVARKEQLVERLMRF